MNPATVLPKSIASGGAQAKACAHRTLIANSGAPQLRAADHHVLDTACLLPGKGLADGPRPARSTFDREWRSGHVAGIERRRACAAGSRGTMARTGAM